MTQAEYLETALRNFNSNDNNEREAANQYLNERIQGELMPLLESIIGLLDLHKEDINFVRTCIVMVGRILKIRFGRFVIRPKIWNQSINLEAIHNIVSSLLTYDDVIIRQYASHCLARFAEKEIPFGGWQEFYPMVFDQIQNKANNEYIIIGYMNVLKELLSCNTYINGTGVVPFISEFNPQLPQILENVFNVSTQYFGDNSSPKAIILISLELFDEFFKFFESYVNNNDTIRENCVSSIMNCLQYNDDEIHKKAMWLLAKVIKKCYVALNQFMPIIFNMTITDINSEDRRRIIDALDLWIEIGSAELSSSECMNYMQNSSADLLPLTLMMLRRFDDSDDQPEAVEGEAIHKSASLLLEKFMATIPETAGPMIAEVFTQQIVSENPGDRFAACLCLSCLLASRDSQNVLDIITNNLGILIQQCLDPVLLVAENALWVLSRVIDYCHTVLSMDQVLEIAFKSLQRECTEIRERALQLLNEKLRKDNEYDAYADSLIQTFFECLGNDSMRDDMILNALFECICSFIDNLSPEFSFGTFFKQCREYLAEEISDVTRKNREVVIANFMVVYYTFSIRAATPSAFNWGFFIPDMIEVVTAAMINAKDSNVDIEALKTLSLITYLIIGTENILSFAQSMLQIIPDMIQNENTAISSRAAILLSDLITAANAQPPDIREMFQAVSSIYNSDTATIDDKIRILTCLSSMISINDIFAHDVSSDFLLRCLDLSKVKIDDCDALTMLRVFITLSDSYKKFIEIMAEDIQFLLLNINQFVKLIGFFESLMPVDDENAVWKLIMYINTLMNYFGISVGEKLQNTAAPQILMFYTQNPLSERIHNISKTCYQLLMRS